MVAKDEKLAAMAPSSSGSPTQELKKGPWKPEEDMLLIEYVKKHGERDWNMVRKHSGLARCGKSCRLRWNNHLRPNLRKGPFSPDEEKLICELHSKIGNKWARIAAMLPGRTDNEIKNFWNTRVKRLARRGSPLYPADLRCPQPDLLNHYLHLDPSPSPTSSTSTFQSNLQNQLSPTTPNSHSILFPPSPSPSRPQQFSHYDAVLQDSMALYDAALENSRQQRQQEMFESSFHRFKRHRSVPNLTISVPTVRHVALHPFSPLGFSTNSSPLGGSVSMASSPTETSYMHVTPSPHSYTSSPTGMMVSPTALQLGIPASQPSLRLPLSSPPVVNFRPTCLPRTSSFSFDPMLFDLNPATTQTHPQRLAMDAIDNELAFSVEDLGISLDPDTTTIPPDQSSTQISEPQQPVNGINNNAAGNGDTGADPVDEFLKEEETVSIRYEQPEFSTEQAKAFLNELETDWPEESRLNSSISSTGRECNNTESMQELELQDELSNLLCSTELPQSFWDNDNDGLAPNDGVSQSQASHPGHDHLHQLEHFIDDRVGMEMHELLASSAPVAASTSSWDNLPGIYQPWLGSATS